MRNRETGYILMPCFLVIMWTLLFAPAVPAQEKKTELAMGSFHTGTVAYIYSGMFAGYIRRVLPAVAITNEATGGSSENLDLMRRGKLALATASAERIYAAYHGIDRYKDKKTPVSVMWSHSRQPVHMFVKEASNINTFQDLRGKKVVLGPAGSASEIKNSYVLEAYGFTRKEKGKFDFVEFQTIKLSYPEAANALAEGVIDAVIVTQEAPEPSVYELSMRFPMRVIPVDPTMLEKVRAIYPFVWPVNVAAKSYPGQEKELMSVGDDSYVIAHATDVSEEVGYRLTKAYLEQVLPEMAKQMAPLRIFVQNPQSLVEYTPVPVHPGAMKYYRERGITPKMIGK